MKAENKIQAEIVQWFTKNYCLKHHKNRALIFSVPNELGKENAIRTLQAKATGLLSGVSDLIIITPKRKVLFIELKTEIGKQSQSQKEFELRVNALGFQYHVIRSLEQFKNLIQNELSNL